MCATTEAEQIDKEQTLEHFSDWQSLITPTVVTHLLNGFMNCPLVVESDGSEDRMAGCLYEILTTLRLLGISPRLCLTRPQIFSGQMATQSKWQEILDQDKSSLTNCGSYSFLRELALQQNLFPVKLDWFGETEQGIDNLLLAVYGAVEEGHLWIMFLQAVSDYAQLRFCDDWQTLKSYLQNPLTDVGESHIDLHEVTFMALEQVFGLLHSLGKLDHQNIPTLCQAYDAIGAYRLITCLPDDKSSIEFEDKEEWEKARAFSSQAFRTIYASWDNSWPIEQNDHCQMVVHYAKLARLTRAWVLANDENLALERGIIKTTYNSEE